VRTLFEPLFKKLFLDKTDSMPVQLVRYTFVGGTAFVFDFSTLYLFTEYLHIHYLVSAAAAFLVGLTCNYMLSTRWIFNGNAGLNRALEFGVFFLIGAVGLGLNELFLYVLTEWLLVHYLVSKAISSVLVFLWNFLARKFSLYRHCG
jgi:putative flippase GtrA